MAPRDRFEAIAEVQEVVRAIGIEARPAFSEWLDKQRDLVPTSGPFDNASCRIPVEDHVDAFIELKLHDDGRWFIAISLYQTDLFDAL